jgi:hypothetical protein
MLSASAKLFGLSVVKNSETYTHFHIYIYIYICMFVCVHTYDHSFIHQWLYNSTLLGPGLFFSFVNFFFTQTLKLLGRVISPSQGRYLHTGQHKHRINAYTDIRALSGIRTDDPSVRASEDTCLRPSGHSDWHIRMYIHVLFWNKVRFLNIRQLSIWD